MKPITIMAAGAILAGLAAWQGAIAWQDQEAGNSAANPPADAPVEANQVAADAPPVAKTTPLIRGITPMAERVAVLGVLNKRNGIAREIKVKPGQAVRLGDLIVRLRACEKTAPWEHEKLTGAFIQTDVRGRDNKWRRYFSGWVYAESPSLNVVEHPIYDVWPKSCAMNWPDAGPDTLVAAAPVAGASASSAKKSPDVAVAVAPAPDTPAPATALDNNAR